ncbi:MAG: F0F1 ATP synthase subunit delta [Peptostreptococcaceae bacterium]
MIASRYALALFEVCEETDSFDEIYSDLENVCAVLLENENLNGVLKSPIINREEKKNLLLKVFTDINKTTKNFLQILIDKQRINVLSEIKIHFKKLINEKLNIIEGTAITAVKMSDDEINNLQEKLSNKYSKNVTLTNIVDETVIGGVLVRLGNEEIDGTVKANLAKLKDNLSQVIS